MKPVTKQAYDLFHEGVLALSQVEADGMRIDVPRLDRTIEKTAAKIERMTERLKRDEVWRLWRRRFGDRAKIGSRHQLGKILFGEMAYKIDAVTDKGKAKMDGDALSGVDLPFVRHYLMVEKYKKMLSTNLRGIRREVVDGFLRPSFNLHLVTSFRSSSDKPNFQNQPVRDKLIGRAVRSCFVPRDGRVLVEVDYSALEFRVAACHWRDEKMIEYASDPALDIHRDMAAECYAMNRSQVTGAVRFFAKNQFVFPELYGSWYVNCAANLWSVIDSAKLTTRDGVPLKEHLRSKGVTAANFERHVKGVEERFNRMFPTWSRKKEEWWSKYRRRGWFPTMTGFRVAGVWNRKQLMNFPIQGPAFHCLLWSLINMMKKLRAKKMRSMITGQIHDSLVLDVCKDELDDVLAKVVRVMTVDVRRAWPWLVVPLSVDAKMSETNWHEMRSVEP